MQARARRAPLSIGKRTDEHRVECSALIVGSQGLVNHDLSSCADRERPAITSPPPPHPKREGFRCTRLNFWPLALVSLVNKARSSKHWGSKMDIAAFVCLMVLLTALPIFFMVR
jgi:hypothetical protein